MPISTVDITNGRHYCDPIVELEAGGEMPQTQYQKSSGPLIPPNIDIDAPTPARTMPADIKLAKPGEGRRPGSIPSEDINAGQQGNQ
jgi:hypothetical protein